MDTRLTKERGSSAIRLWMNGADSRRFPDVHVGQFNFCQPLQERLV